MEDKIKPINTIEDISADKHQLAFDAQLNISSKRWLDSIDPKELEEAKKMFLNFKGVEESKTDITPDLELPYEGLKVKDLEDYIQNEDGSYSFKKSI